MQTSAHTSVGSLDMSLPALPPRSRLDHLEPIGIEEANTECIISYIYRLAEAHVVTARSLLLSEIFPLLNRNYLDATKSRPRKNIMGSFSPAVRTLNGTGDLSKDCVQALERLTLVERLDCLTMLTWRNVLGEMYLIRHSRAWCPQCYEDWRIGGDVIYEPLVWTLQMVKVCATHLRPLETECPSCRKSIPFTFSNTRLGHCSRCKEWLGTELNYEEAPGISSNGLKYQQWVAENLGALIAAAPSISLSPPRQAVERAISLCIERVASGNNEAFARMFNTSKTVLGYWKAGKAIPRIDMLLRICFHFDISVLDFITRPDEVFDPKHEESSSWGRLKIQPSYSRLQRERKKQILVAALDEDPPPSPSEIEARIGFKYFYDLKRSHPDLYEKVNARYLSSAACIEKRRFTRYKKVTEGVAQERVMKALEEEPPPSVEELAKEFGYSNGSTLHQRLPELMRLLVKRREEYFSEKKKSIRHALRGYLRRASPLSLKMVSSDLSMSEQVLRYHAPDLCIAISKRYMEHRTLASKIYGTLKEAMKENPPPSFKEVIGRTKYSRGIFYKYWPDLCYQLTERHQQHIKKISFRKKKDLKEAIRLAVSSLHISGVCPSEKRVMQLLTIPISLNFRDFYELYREVRREVTGA